MRRRVIENSKKIDNSKIVDKNKKMIRSSKIAGNIWTPLPTGRVVRLAMVVLMLLAFPMVMLAQSLPTLSTESSRTYYRINVAKNDAAASYRSTYNISPTTPASVQNASTDEEIWYFVPATLFRPGKRTRCV